MPDRVLARGAAALIVLCALLAGGCATGPAKPPLQTVRALDLDRYLGTWYEIASYPNRFQRGCVATRATYSRLPDGAIRVVNECRQDTLEGKLRTIEGKAWVVGDAANPARLEVQFFWPFRGNYWVIGLDPDYQWAIVGEPSRRYLWILARTPHISEQLFDELVAKAREAGYDPARIKPTLQPG